MFESIKKMWNTYEFEIILVGCLVFIIIFSIFRIGKSGSWSTSYYYNQKKSVNTSQFVSKRKAPKESIGEKECRRVLKMLFNREFNNCRPNFLSNPVTGGHFNLELDCYDELLRLAVEYQGQQHYLYNSFMHKNKEAFYNQKYRDDMKRRKCKDNKVNLIEVSYKVKTPDIEQYLRTELTKQGYSKYFVN
jgi:hypothetical protein